MSNKKTEDSDPISTTSEKTSSSATKDNKMFAEFSEFVSQFKGESDRAAVILGASKLDQQLGMILERHFIPCANSTDELFLNNGPLGTFSAKIDLAYRLGLIDSNLCRAIHLVRKIRNSFAHEVYGASLNNGSHKDRIKSLIMPMHNNDSFKYLKENFFHGAEDSKADFSTALGLIIARLEGLLQRIEMVCVKPRQTLLPENK